MAITAGSDALASDFVATSAGSGDSGKSPKLNGSGVLDPTFVLQSGVQLTAGEALADKDAVAVGDGTTTTVSSGTDASAQAATLSTTAWSAMQFTTPSSNIASVATIGIGIKNLLAGPQNGTFTIELWSDSGGSPSSMLGTASTGSLAFTNAQLQTPTVTFGTNVAVNVSTKYWIVVKCTAFSGSGFAAEQATQSTNVGKNTSNSGGSWSAYTNEFIFTYTYAVSDLGKLYKASAASNNYRFKNWIGFNKGACSSGGTAIVVIGGMVDFLTGLTQGTYFLSDTNGAIATSAGSNSKKVGLAITATQLLIKHDNA